MSEFMPVPFFIGVALGLILFCGFKSMVKQMIEESKRGPQ